MAKLGGSLYSRIALHGTVSHLANNRVHIESNFINALSLSHVRRHLYTACSDVTKFDSIYVNISDRHIVGQVYLYCNRKIIVCRLSRMIDSDKFKSLGIDNCPHEISRTEWTDDSVAPQNGIDNIDIAND